MSIRWVPAAVIRPNRCSFIPFIGSHHPKGFFDAGTEIMAFDGHAYCSVVAAEQMAALMGWVPSGDVMAARARVAEVEAELEAAREETAAVRRELAAVEVLKQGSFTQTRPPGRPKKAVA